MDKLKRKNLWFLEIMTNKKLKDQLLKEILEEG